MKVLVSPAPFKGSLSPQEAARAIASGLREAFPNAELQEIPVADGGEGTLDALLDHFGGEERTVHVEDPLRRKVEARYGFVHDGSTAIIESAQANGLTLLTPEERDPLKTSSYGVGQLLRDVLDQGVQKIWIGLGGSATVDGGTGMLQALGARLRDIDGREIPRGGRGLRELAAIDLSGLDVRLKAVKITALCDVKSPLLGSRGARLYMPQKGATPQISEELEGGLERLAEVAARDVGIDVREIPGAGAAGGLGAALALLGASLVSGSEFLIGTLDVETHMQCCDLVVGGEGRIDEQTSEGKVIAALAHLAKRHAKPFVVLCGSRCGDLSALHEAGVTAVFSIVSGPISLEEALARAAENLRETARQLGALVRARLRD